MLKITGSDVGIRYEPAGLTFVKNRIGSPDRATAEIGFTAAVVPLEDGLRALIEWRRDHKREVDERRARAPPSPLH